MTSRVLLGICVPDLAGLEIFAFHGNVNKPLYNVEAGEMSVDVRDKTADGRWVYFNENRRLKVGDVISYWVWIQVDRRGYQRLGLTHRITGNGQRIRKRVKIPEALPRHTTDHGAAH